MSTKGARSGTREPSKLKEVLSVLGYESALLERDYTVWLREGLDTADLVAFGRQEPKDMTTAALVVEVAYEDFNRNHLWSRAIGIAQNLAAPLAAVADSDNLSIVTVSADGRVEHLVDIAYEAPSLSSELARQLGPRWILQAKTGARSPGLFPIDISLLELARLASGERLAPRVERALIAAVEELGSPRHSGTPNTKERVHQEAARLVVGALSALVLRDKESLGSLPPGALIDIVTQRHPGEFAWTSKLNTREIDALTGVIAGLGDDISFQGIDPAILASVYENTLISDIRRRELGVHYTPPGLARRILAELPIEELAPGERSVLDPTCGSGGMLLAAHDRLRELQPNEWNMDESHRDLAEHLSGYDADPFAVEIARLSLFLHALPAGNGWDVKTRNTLSVKLSPEELPAIIVANPPWGNTNTTRGRRLERADGFLMWMLQNLRPGGFLGVVMPIGWLNNKNSSASRKHLHDTCDIFEIWRLPKGTFESAKNAPAVIFARRRESKRRYNHVLYRRAIDRPALQDLYRGTKETESFLVRYSSIVTNEGSLITGPLTQKFRASDGPVLREVADVVAGPQPLSGFRDRSTSDSDCWFLPLATKLQAFSPLNTKDLIKLNFPEDFQSSRGSQGLDRRKVIVPAVSGPDTPWRLRSGLDLQGVLVRNSMHMVIPKHDNDDILYGLFAFLGSGFASCWIDELAVERNISTADILSIPIPNNELAWRSLRQIGQALIGARLDSQSMSHATQELDSLVWDVMGVSSHIRDRLIEKLSLKHAPEGGWRYVAQSPRDVAALTNSAARNRFGAVLAVDDSRLLLSIPGHTPSGGVWLEPPPGFPAALCQPGSTFDVWIPDNGLLSHGIYRYQPMSWLDDDTLHNKPAYHPASSA